MRELTAIAHAKSADLHEKIRWSKNTKRVVVYLAVSAIACLSVFYAWCVPSVPVIMTNIITHTASTSLGVVVIKHVFLVRVSLTTVVSTSTIVQAEKEYEVIVRLTIHRTLTESYQTTITSWLEYFTSTTESIPTTKHQALVEACPTLRPILPVTLIGALVMILAYRRLRM